MVWGYGSAALHREPRWAGDAGGRCLRDLQRLRALPVRAREAPREACLAMCGICGVLQVGGNPRRVVAPEVLDR